MNSKRIWDKLIAAGMTFAGAAALMGNLKAESNLEPTNLQNTYEHKLGHTDATYTAAVDDGSYNGFVADAAGYGLAQWTAPTRKAKLLAFAKSQGKSIGDLDMQVEFLIHELCTDFPVVWQVLTSTQDVRAASDVVLLRFERPADTSERVRMLRAGFVTAANDATREEKRRTVPKYSYPPELVTTAAIYHYAKYGIEFVIPRSESVRISALDAQRPMKKAIFGCGWLISERLTSEREKAEREKAEREKAEREKAEREKAERFPLSTSELALVKELSSGKRLE